MTDPKIQLEKSVHNYFKTINTIQEEAEKLKAAQQIQDQEKTDQSNQLKEQSQNE